MEAAALAAAPEEVPPPPPPAPDVHPVLAGDELDPELEKSQEALESESGKLEREARVHALRSATEDYTRALAEQVEELRGALPKAEAEKAARERELARLESALVALRGSRAAKEAPRAPAR